MASDGSEVMIMVDVIFQICTLGWIPIVAIGIVTVMIIDTLKGK